MSTTKYIIIDAKKSLHEYEAASLQAVLSTYIEKELLYEKGFTLSKTDWETVLSKLDTTATSASEMLVSLVNGLCVKPYGKITRVISGYTIDFEVDEETTTE